MADASDYNITDGEKLNILAGYGVITTTSKAPVTGLYKTTSLSAQLPKLTTTTTSGAINMALSCVGVLGAAAVATLF